MIGKPSPAKLVYNTMRADCNILNMLQAGYDLLEKQVSFSCLHNELPTALQPQNQCDLWDEVITTDTVIAVLV